MLQSLLRLAPLTIADVSLLLPILSDQRVVIPSGLRLPTDPGGLRWACQTLITNHHCFAIRLAEPAHLVGMIVCDPVVGANGDVMPHQFEIAYLLDHHYWGRRIMTRAVKLFLMTVNPTDRRLVVTAKTLATNLASMKVLKHVGFVKIATANQQVIKWYFNRCYPFRVAGQQPLRV